MEGQYVTFYSDECQIQIVYSDLNKYYNNLFQVIHRFENGSYNSSHRIQGISAQDMKLIEDFFFCGIWNEFKLPSVTLDDGTFIEDFDALDYLGLPCWIYHSEHEEEDWEQEEEYWRREDETEWKKWLVEGDQMYGSDVQQIDGCLY
jgi:hypothetical protein